jgi:hypothetical protein
MTSTINQTKLTAQKFLMLGEDPPAYALNSFTEKSQRAPAPLFHMLTS